MPPSVIDAESVVSGNSYLLFKTLNVARQVWRRINVTPIRNVYDVTGHHGYQPGRFLTPHGGSQCVT